MHISDTGWGIIIQQLKYKTDWSEGSTFHQADRYYPSSKTCSACGSVKTKLSLSERTYTCANTNCSLVLDRDVNAARNLAELALEQSRKEGNEVLFLARAKRSRLKARGEPVSLSPSGQHSSLKRAGPSEGHPGGVIRSASLSNCGLSHT